MLIPMILQIRRNSSESDGSESPQNSSVAGLPFPAPTSEDNLNPINLIFSTFPAPGNQGPVMGVPNLDPAPCVDSA